MICAAATALIDRLEEDASTPPRGTGPLGAGPGGTRWIGVADVLVWNAKTHTDREAAEWNMETDPIVPRTFRETEIPLRDYQLSACESALDGGVFRSGSIVMGCGDGKSRVAAELIRRSRRPAVILAPHSVCVDQWVTLIRTFVTEDVWTLSDARRRWKLHSPVPDVLVSTYHSLVRVTKRMRLHRKVLEGDAVPSSDTLFGDDHTADRLLLMLMCKRFGLLIMDEVHMAVADYFISSGCLRASAVYGLSGSLVREDERISRLMESVGPTLVTHFTPREVHIQVVTVPMSEEHRLLLSSMRKRSMEEQTLRAMNPLKIHALRTILTTHTEARVLVFCDILRVAEILHRHQPGALLMTGRDDSQVRDATLACFQGMTTGGLLVCTHVGDASINFPPGCVVVQYHVSSGSRQQEVQRCGRGTRDLSLMSTFMYHIVNEGTDEANYVTRRVEHLRDCMSSGVIFTERTLGLDEVSPTEADAQMGREAMQQRSDAVTGARPGCGPTQWNKILRKR